MYSSQNINKIDCLVIRFNTDIIFPSKIETLDDILKLAKLTREDVDTTKRVESNVIEVNYPKNKVICEPLMSKRNLYPAFLTKKTNTIPSNDSSTPIDKVIQSYLDFLQYADGTNSLEKISSFIKLDLNSVKKMNFILQKNKLITN